MSFTVELDEQTCPSGQSRSASDAGRISGGPGRAIAYANTAFRKKPAAVMAAMPSTAGITTAGPVTSGSVLPCIR